VYSGVVPVGGFSVSPGESLVQLIRAGEPKYVSVTAEAVGDGPVPSQRVVVTLPQKRGLQFASDHRLIVGVMQGSQWTEKGSYTGTLAADGQTLTFERVDLALSGKGTKSGLLVAAKASADATPGDTTLNVQVGDQTSASSLIQVA
jgi:uncharacterized membrane protein